MAPGVRKLVLSVHIAVSVGWLGAVAAYVALDAAAATGRDEQTLRAARLGMELVARRVIVPLAIATLVTGLVVSLGTKWGLFRHYWVLISLALTLVATAVLLLEIRVIAYQGRIAADPGASLPTLRRLATTLPHSVGGTLVLLVVLVLNIYKPRGMTRYGRRKERATGAP
ncbi:MAG: hypothetical protein ACRDHV_07065 [Actinomycetota bacterium]